MFHYFRLTSFLFRVEPLPLAHLSILISAEFSLFPYFLFKAQHLEPYVIAGLMIVLKTLSFNVTGIFQSHITPDTSFHFIHSILILLLTSAWEPASFGDSSSMYLKDVTLGSSASTLFADDNLMYYTTNCIHGLKNHYKLVQWHLCQGWIHTECVGEDDNDIVGMWTCTTGWLRSRH